MNQIKNRILIGICLSLVLMSLFPLSQSQVNQSYFWITNIGNNINIFQTTNDLNDDYIQISEIAIAGRGNVTLLDGLYGIVLSNYSISSQCSFNALAVGNLDTDAYKEIAAGSQDGNLLVILKYNITTEKFTKLWEKNYNVTQIQISDINGDSVNEVIIGDMLGNLTVFDKTGNLLWTLNLTQSIENVKCLDFSQDAITDRILVLTKTFVTLLNNSGDQEWRVSVTSKPLNGIIGDVFGDDDLELLVKTQKITICLDQTGGLLWNSSTYTSNSSAIMLYNSAVEPQSEILIAGNNGSYLLNGTNGALIRSYLSNSSVTCLAIGTIFGDIYNYLMMGDINRNITIWNMDPQAGFGVQLLLNITLAGSVVDIVLRDMNNDGILDMVIASSDGTVYIIGLPWLVDFTWVLVGIGIGAAIIIVSFIIVIKSKPPSQPKDTKYHIK